MSTDTKVEPAVFIFADDGVIPNNPLPFLVYRGAVDISREHRPTA
jgi:uncharacterized protein YjlB